LCCEKVIEAVAFKTKVFSWIWILSSIIIKSIWLLCSWCIT
jgi:hypothetical protein